MVSHAKDGQNKFSNKELFGSASVDNKKTYGKLETNQDLKTDLSVGPEEGQSPHEGEEEYPATGEHYTFSTAEDYKAHRRAINRVEMSNKERNRGNVSNIDSSQTGANIRPPDREETIT